MFNVKIAAARSDVSNAAWNLRMKASYGSPSEIRDAELQLRIADLELQELLLEQKLEQKLRADARNAAGAGHLARLRMAEAREVARAERATAEVDALATAAAAVAVATVAGMAWNALFGND